jgi:hypothetical protein
MYRCFLFLHPTFIARSWNDGKTVRPYQNAGAVAFRSARGFDRTATATSPTYMAPIYAYQTPLYQNIMVVWSICKTWSCKFNALWLLLLPFLQIPGVVMHSVPVQTAKGNLHNVRNKTLFIPAQGPRSRRSQLDLLRMFRNFALFVSTLSAGSTDCGTLSKLATCARLGGLL